MEALYYVTTSGERRGPYTLHQLRKMWASGLITADSDCSREGSDERLPIISLQEMLEGQSGAEKNTAFSASSSLESNKRILPALIFWFLFGVCGGHAFYAGREKQGLLFLIIGTVPIVFTLSIYMGGKMSGGNQDVTLLSASFVPLIFLGALVIGLFLLGDLIRIVAGTYIDGDGRKIAKWV